MSSMLIAGIVFTSITFMVLLIGLAFSNRGKTADDRLREAAVFGAQSVVQNRLHSARAIVEENKDSSLLVKVGDMLTSDEEIAQSPMKIRLSNAGYNGENAVRSFIGAKFVLAILSPAFYAFILFLLRKPLDGIFMHLIVFAAIGFFLPEVFVYIQTRSRREQLFCGLPDALDLMVICVEAGLGLDAAFQKVADEIHISNKVLSEELNLTCLEIRAGRPRRDALNNLALRAGIPDMKSLVTVLVQAERFGTNTAQALRTHSDDMRLRRRQRAEEAAAKTAVKLVFPLVLFIFPCLFIVLAGPAMIRLTQSLFAAG